MPNHVIRRVAPIALANALAVVWGVVAIVMLLLIGLVASIEHVLDSGVGFAHVNAHDWFFMAFAPVLYALFGWIVTAIGATTFNLVAGLTGGIRIELEPWTGPGRARTEPEAAVGAHGPGPVCSSCGTAYDAADYRPDADAPRCSVCGAELTLASDVPG